MQRGHRVDWGACVWGRMWAFLQIWSWVSVRDIEINWGRERGSGTERDLGSKEHFRMMLVFCHAGYSNWPHGYLVTALWVCSGRLHSHSKHVVTLALTHKLRLSLCNDSAETHTGQEEETSRQSNPFTLRTHHMYKKWGMTYTELATGCWLREWRFASPYALKTKAMCLKT